MLSRGVVDEARLDEVVGSVLRRLSERFGAEKIPHVEEVQDLVDASLMEHGLK